ncbi:MAG TPA: potassium transporter TrkG [Bacteroidales bacterium]|nr:potassium transporter TrkG [Bacteroidales bacterium]
MKRINFKSLLKIIGLILIIISISFLLCIPVAIIYSESAEAFIFSSLIILVPGLLIFFFVRSPINEKISVREGYLGVTIAWLTLALAGTLPYILSGTIPGFVNILFETVSGFTTTGASILQDVEILPKSILFWRSLTHWIGGVGIILLVIIILPTLKVGGYNLFSLESSMKQKILPKTKSIAYRILFIYLGITIGEIILLSFGGMSLFDSVCHSFGTVATGGFSTRNTSISGYSSYIQYVIAIFMFISATSYVVFYFLVKGKFKKVRANEELRLFILFTSACIAFVTLVLYFGSSRTFEESFRHSFFQVVSQISTTGYATADYMLWPQVGWFFMFIIMFAGGSTGSTAGGIKMARHLILLKNLRNIFVRIQHSSAVLPVRMDDKIISENINFMMLVFILLYFVIFLTGTLIMIGSGVPVAESAGASATSLAGIGPGLGRSGNFGNYAHFTAVAKSTMIALMIIGRLELFTILALFTRSFWRN